MKTKKFMSLILALVMALSLAVPAFATTATLETTDLTDMSKIDTAVTQVNGIYQAPILALTVPKKINLLLNPYGVNVTINKDTAIEDDVQGQIVSADNLIISRSNVPIEIKATATGTITSGGGETGAWTLSKTPIASNSVKKEALVYMVFGTVDTSTINDATKVTKFIKTTKTTSDTPYEGLSDRNDITYATVTPATLAEVTFVDATTKKDGIIIQAGEGKETWLNQSLAECSVTETVNNGTTTYSYNSVSAVAFKLDGAMVANPKDSSWGKDDKLAISVAWKFVPGPQANSSGSSQTVTPDATVAAGSYTVDKTGTLSTKDISSESVFSDKDNTTPNFQITAQSVDLGATITTAGIVSFNKTKVDNVIDAQNNGTAYAAGDKISTILTVTYSDGTDTQTKNIKMEITLT
jgi:hypothetical protein